MPPKSCSQTQKFNIVVITSGQTCPVAQPINFSFGSRIIIPELGFILNNEMDDFSAKPGVRNAFGLIGGVANAVQAGKRPLSSMTPVMVFKDNKPWLISGSPGGSKIITSVLQVLLNVIDHKMNIAEATMAPRIHHQWQPDILNLEKNLPNFLYKIPYEILNRMNRNKLQANDNSLVSSISTNDYSLQDDNSKNLDLFLILEK